MNTNVGHKREHSDDLFMIQHKIYNNKLSHSALKPENKHKHARTLRNLTPSSGGGELLSSAFDLDAGLEGK